MCICVSIFYADMAKLTLNAGCIRAAEVKAPFLLMTLNCSDRKEKKNYGS